MGSDTDKADNETMRLPGKSVLVFTLVASGVFMVYYFSNMSGQTDADKKSDLVWLQKILNANKHRLPDNHRAGHYKHRIRPDFHFYNNQDDTDHDDYADTNGGFDGDSLDTYTTNGEDDFDDYNTDSDWELRNKHRPVPSKAPPYRTWHGFGANYRANIIHPTDDNGGRGIAALPLDASVNKDGFRAPKQPEDTQFRDDTNRETSDKYGQTSNRQSSLVSVDWSTDRKVKHGEVGGERDGWYHGKTSNSRNKFLSLDGFKRFKYPPIGGAQDKDNVDDYPTYSKGDQRLSAASIYDKYGLKSKLTSTSPFIVSTHKHPGYSTEQGVSRASTDTGGHDTDTIPGFKTQHSSNTPHTPWPLSHDRNIITDSDDQHINGIITNVTTQPNRENSGLNANSEPIKSTEASNRKPETKSLLTSGGLLKGILIPKPNLQINPNVLNKNETKTSQESTRKDGQNNINVGTITPKMDTVRDEVIKKDEITEIKKHIVYPKSIKVFDWSTPPKSNVKPKCVPMQTVSNFVRVCIHPVEVDHDVSSRLKSQASWEFNGMRDVEIAVLEGKDIGFIDLGAGIGEYSLAIASFKRHVIAVEPYNKHVEIFQSSVHLNNVEEYVTLVCNVVSDTNYWVKMEHEAGHINEVTFKSVLGHHLPNESITSTITLNQLANYVPFKKAVLKIDIPNFIKSALSASDELFDRVEIKYVFTHWTEEDLADKEYIVSFFAEHGYEPFTQLHGGKKLDQRIYREWVVQYIVWKKIDAFI